MPLIVASALIMQQIDSTALATALPSISTSLGVPSLSLHAAITVYLLSLGVFLPISGWLADRFGARKIFCWAIALFTFASLLCALSTNLTTLVLARLLQGFGGALMLPVARLILVRSVSRAELVSAMVLMSMPSLIGPAVGPLLGGFITSVSSWRWIFLINLPVGIVGIVLTLLFIDKIPPAEKTRFDVVGFLLSGCGIGAIIFGLDSASDGLNWDSLLLAAVGLAALGLYVPHSRRRADPILDLKLFRHPSFRSSVIGGSLFRLGFGALPFMLPLMLQEVFGYSPLQSGAITFVGAIGAFGMRTITERILRRFGFRQVLIWNALIASFSMGLCGAFTKETAPLVMVAIITIGGVFRALEYTAINTIAFADVEQPEMSHATALSQMAQRISQSIGVAAAATLLQVLTGGGALTNLSFLISFVIVAVISGLSCVSFILLPANAGDTLAGRKKPGDAEENLA